MMASKGAIVEGFDVSKGILEVAKGKINAENLGDKVNLMTFGIAEMESKFKDERFDKVVSTLVFSKELLMV